MSDVQKPAVGSFVWVDLTVPDADRVRDFYQEVVGWRPRAVPMGDYDDYSMEPPAGGDAVAGVCHARGTNEGIPPQWLHYIVVGDLDQSLERCQSLGGRIVREARNLGSGRFAVIEDPTGAVSAIYEEGRSE
jgi:predicted enzyme related to lactoylglutathione lyase